MAPHRASTGRRRDRNIYSPGPRARSTERSYKTNDFEEQRSYRSTDEEDDEEEQPVVEEDPVVLVDSANKKKNRRLSYGTLERSVSDPFDATHDDDKALPLDSEFVTVGLPTLPRFPVAETRDLNCWSEPQVDMFHVRGSNYLKDKKKVASGNYLLRARGADLLLTEKGYDAKNLGRNPCVFGGSLYQVPTFIVNFILPWGVVAQYFEIPAHLAAYLRPNPPPLSSLTNAEVTLAKFFMGNTEYKNARLKLIPYVAAGPWIVKNMVTGKPAIMGTKLPVSYHYQPPRPDGGGEYLEADLDIGSSSKTAKRIVSVCKRYMTALTIDLGYVIQANTDEELPEQMLGSVRLHSMDPNKAPTVCKSMRDCRCHKK